MTAHPNQALKPNQSNAVCCMLLFYYYVAIVLMAVCWRATYLRHRHEISQFRPLNGIRIPVQHQYRRQLSVGTRLLAWCLVLSTFISAGYTCRTTNSSSLHIVYAIKVCWARCARMVHFLNITCLIQLVLEWVHAQTALHETALHVVRQGLVRTSGVGVRIFCLEAATVLGTVVQLSWPWHVKYCKSTEYRNRSKG